MLELSTDANCLNDTLSEKNSLPPVPVNEETYERKEPTGTHNQVLGKEKKFLAVEQSNPFNDPF